MLIQLPKSDRHSSILLVVDTPEGRITITVMNTLASYDVRLPAGVKDSQCRIVAMFLKPNFEVDTLMSTVVLQEPEPEPEPVKVASVKKTKAKNAPQLEPPSIDEPIEAEAPEQTVG
jgi:hypothetical protein